MSSLYNYYLINSRSFGPLSREEVISLLNGRMILGVKLEDLVGEEPVVGDKYITGKEGESMCIFKGTVVNPITTYKQVIETVSIPE